MFQTWYDDGYYWILLVKWSWPWFKVTGVQESKNFSSNFLISFDEIWYAVEIWWSHSFYLVQSIFRGENSTCVIPSGKKLWCWLAFRHLQTDFFQFWYDCSDNWTLHIDTSLDDPELPSKSQLHEKSKTSAVIFFTTFPNQCGWNLVCCHKLLVCWSSGEDFLLHD